MKVVSWWIILAHIIIIWPQLICHAELSRFSSRGDSRRRKIVPAEYVDFIQSKRSYMPSEFVDFRFKYKSKGPKMLAIRLLATDIRRYQWEVFQSNQSIPNGGEGTMSFNFLLPALIRVGHSIVQLDAFAHYLHMYVALIEPKMWQEQGIASVHLAGINNIYSLNIWGHSVSFCENVIEQYRDKTCKKESGSLPII